MAVFVAAATPVPDEPVIIPLGLMKYNPGKLSLAYFSGKFCVASLGAYLGGFGEEVLGGYVSQVALAVISIVLIVAITVILLKVDLPRITERILKRLKRSKYNERAGEKTRDQQLEETDC